MALTITRYHKHRLNALNGLTPLSATDTWMLGLLSDAYTPDIELDEVWGDVSAHEVANGAGYTTNGEELTTVSLTINAAGVITLDADDVSWTALTKTWKYGILYLIGSYDGGNIINPLVAVVDFDDSATDATVTVTGIDYWIIWSVNGIMRLARKGDI